MSVQEKRWWAYLTVAVIVPVTYFAVVLAQIAGHPVNSVSFQVPLLIAGTVGVILSVQSNIILTIAARMSSPAAPVADERDRVINRRGEYVAGIVLLAAMAVPFALTLLEVEYFWIANAMYLAFVISAVAGSAVKIAAYRRGF